MRSRVISAMRSVLDSKGFLEVETPVLQPIYGGAAARPFKTFLNELKMDVYLRISNELYLKRLIVGGFDKVYEFAKDFRNEGIDKTHNPEFTQVELYWAYADYNDIMDIFEELIREAAMKALGTTKIEFNGQKIDLSKKWRRLPMLEGIKQYAKIDAEKMSLSELKKFCEKNKIEIENSMSKGLIINEIFEAIVEPHLVEPTFVMDHPKETTPLCKVHRKNPDLVERFEAYVGGMEVCNAYSELNDPQVQKELLKEQVNLRELGDEESHPMDDDFVRALEYGMPPTGGLGIGIDRITMLFANTQLIREVLFFPFMRPLTEAEQKELEKEEEEASKPVEQPNQQQKPQPQKQEQKPQQKQPDKNTQANKTVKKK